MEFLLSWTHFIEKKIYIAIWSILFNQQKEFKVRLIYTFSLSFSSSFAFQTGKFTSSYIWYSNDKWNDISNDWMLSVQMQVYCISKEIGAKDASHFK